MKRFLLMAACLLALPAIARQPDGTLGLILTPNNGMPALVLPGATFEAVLEEEAALSLVSDAGAVPLAVTWSPLPGSRVRGACTVPETLAPGAYALHAEGAAQQDQMPRAVYVRENFPDYYVIAHVSDTHLGSGRHPRTSEEINRDVFSAVNASDATLVLVSGDLTENGAPEQFRAFLDVLDTCALPTFVCPGNHDRQALNYEQFFGPLTYAFTFGKDGYLSFDTKDYLTADELGPQDGDLERLRRQLKPSRWSIGFSHRYEASQGMRGQIALYVDNPLDYLLFGHWHRENSKEQQTVPWGPTRITVVPAAINGAIRLIDVTAKGLLPRPFETVAKTGRE